MTSITHTPDNATQQDTSAQRTDGHRFGLLIAIGCAWTIALLIGTGIGGDGGAVLVQGILLAGVVRLGTRVGYRARDWLLLLVPFANYYYIVKVLWRATALPHAYWATREALA
ncbi:MAG: hypothetical protein ACRDZO_07725 [Egibacteraceae bacterium]